MAKRKRLTPARSELLAQGGPVSEPGTAHSFRQQQVAVPIARVAGDTALQATVDDLSAELHAARAEGRMIQFLPLSAIEETHLVRDRITADAEEMSALVESLRSRGQQTPIDVVELGEGRFGLISGWRRLTALRKLHAETGEDRFATVQALLRRPDRAADAYLAMVEENEIRVGLSYYERARIAARAVELGVYASETEALRGLFATASRAKRSKIKSFIAIYDALDEHLRFAAEIPERLGLALAKALKTDSALGVRMAGELAKVRPDTAEAEAALLAKLIKAGRGAKEAPDDEPSPERPEREVVGGVTLTRSANGRTVTLKGMTDELHARLKEWLAAQS